MAVESEEDPAQTARRAIRSVARATARWRANGPTAEASHRARCLACHPVAAMYLSFTQPVRAGESARVELLRLAEVARRRLSLAS
jgi:hypothetical protein